MAEKKEVQESNTSSSITEQKTLIEKRKERLLNIFKGKGNFNVNILYALILIAIALYAFNVRTSNIPYLRDVATGNYTLGPDLDPFLFLRWARYIAEHGSLMQIDSMRYVPLGFDTSGENKFLPYLIVYLYKFLKMFNKSMTVDLAAILYPAVMFVFATIAFFFFTRRLFVKYSMHKRNIIAVISTLFFISMPSLLHRTVAGIPEKEAGGIFFMFLTFYFFVVSLQAKNMKNAIIFGLLAGISTGLLGLVWGAVTFAFLGIGLSMLILFLIRNTDEKGIAAYLSWVVVFTFILSFFTKKYGRLAGLFASTTSELTYFVAALMIVDFILSKTFYKKEGKLPRILASIFITIGLAFLFVIATNPGMILHAFNDIRVNLLHPIGTDRITLTVAENNQPYFGTWKGTFGIRLFWLFFVASILIFYEIVKELKKNEKYMLVSAYVLFIASLIFSRYSSQHIMNGTSFMSQVVYFGSFLMLAAVFSFVYYTAYKNKEVEKFKGTSKEFILLLVLFFWSVISARGAIRLFFLLAPITSILVGFISVEVIEKALKSKRELERILLWIVVAIVIYITFTSLYGFSNLTSAEARATRPSSYNMQWQLAMSWVRQNTAIDAVFSHWWDYGYWIQTLGERATFLDGGNSYGYWDYQMGRYVLTGQNEKEALEVLKTHNVSYLLIDPTDIGKYPAYSSIGSDLGYDRYNWIPVMSLDEKQTQETRNETILVYQGGTTFEEDFMWYDSNKKQQYIMPAQSSEAVIAGVLLPITKTDFITLETIKQPQVVVYLRGSERIDIPLCYLYQNQLIDYRDKGPCMPAALYLIPRIEQVGNQVRSNEMGVALFLNQRAMRALWVNLYLLNKTENFELVHAEQNPVIQQLRQQGMQLPEFVYFGDVQGPIKIWKVNYPEGIEIKPEYLNTTYPDQRLSIPR